MRCDRSSAAVSTPARAQIVPDWRKTIRLCTESRTRACKADDADIGRGQGSRSAGRLPAQVEYASRVRLRDRSNVQKATPATLPLLRGMHERWPVLAPADAGRQARSDGDRSAPCSIAHLDFRNDSAFDSRPLREPPVRDHLPAAAHTDFSRTAYSDCTCSASSEKPQPARRPFNLNAFSLQASPGAGRNRSQKRRTHVCSHICTRTPYSYSETGTTLVYFQLPPSYSETGTTLVS